MAVVRRGGVAFAGASGEVAELDSRVPVAFAGVAGDCRGGLVFQFDPDGGVLDAAIVRHTALDRVVQRDSRLPVAEAAVPLGSNDGGVLDDDAVEDVAFAEVVVKFDDGEVIAGGGQTVHHTFLLLSGTVEVERAGRVLDEESREGTFLCAVSTLTGVAREVTLRAKGTVWACIFNEAELEQLVTCNPAVAVRMIRTLAARLAEGPPRKREA